LVAAKKPPKGPASSSLGVKRGRRTPKKRGGGDPARRLDARQRPASAGRDADADADENGPDAERPLLSESVPKPDADDNEIEIVTSDPAEACVPNRSCDAAAAPPRAAAAAQPAPQFVTPAGSVQDVAGDDPVDDGDDVEQVGRPVTLTLLERALAEAEADVAAGAMTEVFWDCENVPPHPGPAYENRQAVATGRAPRSFEEQLEQVSELTWWRTGSCALVLSSVHAPCPPPPLPDPPHRFLLRMNGGPKRCVVRLYLTDHLEAKMKGDRGGPLGEARWRSLVRNHPGTSVTRTLGRPKAGEEEIADVAMRYDIHRVLRGCKRLRDIQVAALRSGGGPAGSHPTSHLRPPALPPTNTRIVIISSDADFLNEVHAAHRVEGVHVSVFYGGADAVSSAWRGAADWAQEWWDWLVSTAEARPRQWADARRQAADFAHHPDRLAVPMKRREARQHAAALAGGPAPLRILPARSASGRGGRARGGAGGARGARKAAAAPRAAADAALHHPRGGVEKGGRGRQRRMAPAVAGAVAVTLPLAPAPPVRLVRSPRRAGSAAVTRAATPTEPTRSPRCAASLNPRSPGSAAGAGIATATREAAPETDNENVGFPAPPPLPKADDPAPDPAPGRPRLDFLAAVRSALAASPASSGAPPAVPPSGSAPRIGRAVLSLSGGGVSKPRRGAKHNRNFGGRQWTSEETRWLERRWKTVKASLNPDQGSLPGHRRLASFLTIAHRDAVAQGTWGEGRFAGLEGGAKRQIQLQLLSMFPSDFPPSSLPR